MAAKYNKASLIGSGTFGKVWLVRHLSSGRRYVIKEVSVGALNEKERQQTLTEVEVLARCRHVNVIRYREAFLEDATLNIVMSYADGGDLHARIQKQRGSHFPEPVILDWFVQICFALRYIHGLHIVHRDLKTPNIFLSGDNVIKVGDFGIARVLSSTNDHAMTAVGTPYYLSPEICQQQPYNQKSDMWSLGCVLYELCCLTHPFDGQNLAALVIQILNGTYKPIPSHYSAILEDLVSVLLRGQAESRPSAEQVLWVPALQKYVVGHVNRSAAMTPRVTKTPSPVVSGKAQVDSLEADKENIKPNSGGKRSRCHSQSTPKSEAVVERPLSSNSAECNRQSLVKEKKGPVPTLSLYKQVLRKAHCSPDRSKSAMGSAPLRPKVNSKTYTVRKGPTQNQPILGHQNSPTRKRTNLSLCKSRSESPSRKVGRHVREEDSRRRDMSTKCQGSVGQQVPPRPSTPTPTEQIHVVLEVDSQCSNTSDTSIPQMQVSSIDVKRGHIESTSGYDVVDSFTPRNKTHSESGKLKVQERHSRCASPRLSPVSAISFCKNPRPKSPCPETRPSMSGAAPVSSILGSELLTGSETESEVSVTEQNIYVENESLGGQAVKEKLGSDENSPAHEQRSGHEHLTKQLQLAELLYANFTPTQNAAFPLMENLRGHLEDLLGFEQLHDLHQTMSEAQRRAAPFELVVERLKPDQQVVLPRLLILLQLEAICGM